MKKRNSVGRLIGIIILLGSLIYIAISSGAFSSVIDLPSLLLIVVINVSMILFSNQWTDYVRAFKIAMGQREFTTKEMKVSKNAMNLSIHIVFLSGFLGTVIGWVQIAARLSTSESLKAGMAVAALTTLYALMLNLIQLSIKSTINKEIIYRSNEDK